MAEFQEYLGDFQAATDAARAGRTADAARPFRRPWTTIGQACQQCHDEFRLADELMLRRAAVAACVRGDRPRRLSPGSLTAPEPLSAAQLPVACADAGNGERIFHAAGCASCHAAPDAKGEDKLQLGGGLELATDFGIFRVPNISPDPETGIGGWSTLDFANAVLRGVSPGGAHYYPAFPYSSYIRMRPEDVIDLKAFMDTLPPVSNRVAEHDLGFPLQHPPRRSACGSGSIYRPTRWSRFPTRATS